MTRAAVAAPPTVDPALVLAEVVLRLRHAGVDVAADPAAMARAYGHVVGMLGALGLPVDDDVLPELDYWMLRCVAAR